MREAATSDGGAKLPSCLAAEDRLVEKECRYSPGTDVEQDPFHGLAGLEPGPLVVGFRFKDGKHRGVLDPGNLLRTTGSVETQPANCGLRERRGGSRHPPEARWLQAPPRWRSRIATNRRQPAPAFLDQLHHVLTGLFRPGDFEPGVFSRRRLF